MSLENALGAKPLVCIGLYNFLALNNKFRSYNRAVVTHSGIWPKHLHHLINIMFYSNSKLVHKLTQYQVAPNEFSI